MKTMKRRRKEFKTNYLKRIKLLKSGLPRIVFRKTNKYVFAQYITSKEAQDKIEMEVKSRDLVKYGWPKEAQGSLKSITASYFVGLLIGQKISKNKLENPVVDFGMIRSIHKSKVYGFLKGLIDAGIKIKCKEEIFPEETRIKGEHMKNKIPFNEIKSKIENKEWKIK